MFFQIVSLFLPISLFLYFVLIVVSHFLVAKIKNDSLPSIDTSVELISSNNVDKKETTFSAIVYISSTVLLLAITTLPLFKKDLFSFIPLPVRIILFSILLLGTKKILFDDYFKSLSKLITLFNINSDNFQASDNKSIIYSSCFLMFIDSNINVVDFIIKFNCETCTTTISKVSFNVLAIVLLGGRSLLYIFFSLYFLYLSLVESKRIIDFLQYKYHISFHISTYLKKPTQLFPAKILYIVHSYYFFNIITQHLTVGLLSAFFVFYYIIEPLIIIALFLLLCLNHFLEAIIHLIYKTFKSKKTFVSKSVFYRINSYYFNIYSFRTQNNVILYKIASFITCPISYSLWAGLIIISYIIEVVFCFLATNIPSVFKDCLRIIYTAFSFVTSLLFVFIDHIQKKGDRSALNFSFRVSAIISILLLIIYNRYCGLFLECEDEFTIIFELISSAIYIPIVISWVLSIKNLKQNN